MIKGIVKEIAREIKTPYYSRIGKFPEVVSISVNSSCNLRCKMCDVGQRNRESNFYKSMDKGAEIPLKELKELAEELKGSKTQVHFNGVEPLLYKDLPEAIKEFSSRGVECAITTNGYLLAERAKDLVEAGVGPITVSIDGTKKIHNEIRGLPDVYQRAIKGLKLILKLKGPEGLRVAIAVSNYNQNNLYQIVRELKELGIKQVTISHLNFITEEMAELHNDNFEYEFGRVSPSSISAVDLDAIDTKLLNSHLKQIKREFKGVNFIPDIKDKELEVYYKNPTRSVFSNRCNSAWRHMQILSNGDVIVTARCFTTVLGSIYNNTLPEIWNHDKYKDFREAIKLYGSTPSCSRCCGIFSRRNIKETKK